MPYKIHPFKVYKSMVFGIFEDLGNHQNRTSDLSNLIYHQNRTSEYHHHCEKRPILWTVAHQKPLILPGLALIYLLLLQIGLQETNRICPEKTFLWNRIRQLVAFFFSWCLHDHPRGTKYQCSACLFSQKTMPCMSLPCSIYPFMDIWVAPFWLLGIMLQWTLVS